MKDTLEGIDICVSFEQLLKDPAPIDSKEGGISILINEEHPLKVQS